MSRRVFVLAVAMFAASSALAQHPVAPQLSSNPGARYTVFLNFTGFNYSGTWANRTPGNVPAYTLDSDATTFSNAEVSSIKEAWARVATAYVGFNINVTTVDPAGSGMTDSQRKTFYDGHQYMTHTILGGTYNWYGAAGGVSYVGIAQQATTTNGRRTNWVFPVNGSGTAPKTMAAAAVHEDGHHLRLSHQHDEHNGNEYSTNNNAQGYGSYAPIMGASYYSQRGTWRRGKPGTNANDVEMLQGNLNIGPLLDSGVGHSFGTASALAVLDDGTVDPTVSKGFIMPTAESGYSPDVYTTDFFKFNAAGGTVNLTAHDGSQFLAPGVADPGATMRSVLKIYDANGNYIGTSTEDNTTLVHHWSGQLAMGTYYAQVLSYGAYVSAWEPSSKYFNMGPYFLTGSGFAPGAVPEPVSLAVLACGALALVRRRRVL
ncbi:MAG: PEP-CTERM sorting domain-containing protein [Fimbriimonadaceae bacterium]|nr:PEP-CTERM sorting domain-containing protein [Fimbriimonadaceae bacterium]